MRYETERDNPQTGGSTGPSENIDPVDPPENQGGTAADDGGNTTPSDI
jgi:hypothetical protein